MKSKTRRKPAGRKLDPIISLIASHSNARQAVDEWVELREALADKPTTDTHRRKVTLAGLDRAAEIAIKKADAAFALLCKTRPTTVAGGLLLHEHLLTWGGETDRALTEFSDGLRNAAAVMVQTR